MGYNYNNAQNYNVQNSSKDQLPQNPSVKEEKLSFTQKLGRRWEKLTEDKTNITTVAVMLLTTIATTLMFIKTIEFVAVIGAAAGIGAVIGAVFDRACEKEELNMVEKFLHGIINKAADFYVKRTEQKVEEFSGNELYSQ